MKPFKFKGMTLDSQLQPMSVKFYVVMKFTLVSLVFWKELCKRVHHFCLNGFNKTIIILEISERSSQISEFCCMQYWPFNLLGGQIFPTIMGQTWRGGGFPVVVSTGICIESECTWEPSHVGRVTSTLMQQQASLIVRNFISLRGESSFPRIRTRWYALSEGQRTIAVGC